MLLRCPGSGRLNYIPVVVHETVRVQIFVALVERLTADGEHLAPRCKEQRVSVERRYEDLRSRTQILEDDTLLGADVLDYHADDPPLNEQEDLHVIVVEVVAAGLRGSGEVEKVHTPDGLPVHRLPDCPSLILMRGCLLRDKIPNAWWCG